GMVQPGRGLCLAPEPREEGGVPGQVGAQNLDGDGPAQSQVVALVHVGHAAPADQLADLVPSAEDQLLLTHRFTPASRTCCAIGAATTPPVSPVQSSVALSTTTATAILGSCAGANPVNHAWAA